jgi:hypothetical protein
MSDTKTCFTIMPFTVREPDATRYYGDARHWSQVYEGLIVPAAKRAGLACERDDEDSTTRLITQSIWKKIEDADVVLCDLSASNPNVFLELGWALRSDKRFVLIKDDITPRQFDLNQYYTYEYPHRLQPLEVAEAIEKLAEVLLKTLADHRRQYSMVKKLAIDLEAIQASRDGNVEVGLLREVLDEIRSAQALGLSDRNRAERPSSFGDSIQTQEDLASKLPLTSWRKRNGVEVIVFRERPRFDYKHSLKPGWSSHEYSLDGKLGGMTLLWKMDNFKARCQFSRAFTQFVEAGDATFTWSLEWAP